MVFHFMDCKECGVVTDAEQFLFCYDCATKLDKCLHCGGDGNYAGCLTCENCIANGNGRCGCGSPKTSHMECIDFMETGRHRDGMPHE